jgi:hypothetical protein
MAYGRTFLDRCKTNLSLWYSYSYSVVLSLPKTVLALPHLHKVALLQADC